MSDVIAQKKRARPKNLDLRTVRFPITAIVSGVHRITGVGLFLLLPWLLYLFDRSTKSAKTFEVFSNAVGGWFAKLILLGLLWAFLHHLCAGVRFLLLDAHKGLELQTAQKTSYIVFGVSIALTLIIGVILW